MARAKKKTKKAKAPIPLVVSIDKEQQQFLREKALEAALSSIKAKFSDTQIDWLENLPMTQHEVVSTGSIGLDKALGVGGIVLGRMYEFFGHESGGKSTLAYSVLINAVNQGYRCCLIDAEHTFDKNLYIEMGGDPTKLIVVRAHTGEEHLDIAEGLISSGGLDICVFDSVAALVPQAEVAQDSYEDQSIGLHARLMSKMCRKMVPIAGRTKTALIFINQIRMKIGAYGNPETTTGGNSIPFYATVRVKVSGGKSVDSRITDPDSGLIIGHQTTFYIEKNKLSAPYRSAVVDLIYGKGYDTKSELIDIGIQFGLIEQTGAWFKYDGEKYHGKANLLSAIIADKKAHSKLTKEVMATLGLKTLSDKKK